jgi:hypothetical protein
MVGAGVALAGPVMADVSPGEGAGDTSLTEAFAGASWVSVFAQLTSAMMLSKIAKLMNHEGLAGSRRKSGNVVFM